MSRGTAFALFHRRTGAQALAAALAPWAPHDLKEKTIITAKETIVGGFLFLSGVLLMLVGLGAMIEANLHCLSILRGPKGRP
jgi:hypothetical protein